MVQRARKKGREVGGSNKYKNVGEGKIIEMNIEGERLERVKG